MRCGVLARLSEEKNPSRGEAREKVSGSRVKMLTWLVTGPLTSWHVVLSLRSSSDARTKRYTGSPDLGWCRINRNLKPLMMVSIPCPYLLTADSNAQACLGNSVFLPEVSTIIIPNGQSRDILNCKLRFTSYELRVGQINNELRVIHL